MRKFLLTIVSVFLVFLAYNQEQVAIQWVSIEKAFQMNKESKTPKPIFIDVYTDWCGWCKRLDATTFKEAKLVKYLSDNYLCVKLNAEQKEDILFNKHTYHFVKSGKNGYHEFAALLLDGRMAYPSMVVLSPSNQRTHYFAGYMSADALIQKLEK